MIAVKTLDSGLDSGLDSWTRLWTGLWTEALDVDVTSILDVSKWLKLSSALGLGKTM